MLSMDKVRCYFCRLNKLVVRHIFLLLLPLFLCFGCINDSLSYRHATGIFSHPSFLKKIKRYLVCRDRRNRLQKHAVIVLAYHNVEPISQTGDLYIVSERNFRDQLVWLNHFFTIIPADRIEQHAGSGLNVAITFDDGKKNNFESACPILIKHNTTATFFIITDFVGTGEYANWDQLGIMEKNGMSICSHSCTHPDFGQLDSVSTFMELSRSFSALREKMLGFPLLFAYPFGNPHNTKEMEKQLLSDIGYRYGFVFGGGAFNTVADRYRIPRYMVVDIQGVTLTEQLLTEFEKLQ